MSLKLVNAKPVTGNHADTGGFGLNIF